MILKAQGAATLFFILLSLSIDFIIFYIQLLKHGDQDKSDDNTRCALNEIKRHGAERSCEMIEKQLKYEITADHNDFTQAENQSRFQKKCEFQRLGRSLRASTNPESSPISPLIRIVTGIYIK